MRRRFPRRAPVRRRLALQNLRVLPCFLPSSSSSSSLLLLLFGPPVQEFGEGAVLAHHLGRHVGAREGVGVRSLVPTRRPHRGAGAGGHVVGAALHLVVPQEERRSRGPRARAPSSPGGPPSAAERAGTARSRFASAPRRARPGSGGAWRARARPRTRSTRSRTASEWSGQRTASPPPSSGWSCGRSSSCFPPDTARPRGPGARRP